MHEPLFSVVIPAYNAAAFITRTLECLNAQKFSDFETLVVNDGSIDNTQAVITEYIARHRYLNLRLVDQENRGIAAARNKGIREARGRYVAFLDHDDIWYPEKLSRCCEILRMFPQTAVLCHNEALRDISGKIVRYLKCGPYVKDMFRKLLYKGSCFYTSATVVRKDILLEAGLFRENPEFSTGEDYDLWLRLSKKHKIYLLPEILGEYVLDSTNASLNFEKHYNNQLCVLKTNFKEIEEKNISDYFLMFIRITRVYLIIAKRFLLQKKFGKGIKYFILALKRPFLEIWQEPAKRL
jgi:glycosyltransferase involved in cell wall biosynthesis